MKPDTSSKTQSPPRRQTDELPNLTIAEKVCSTQFATEWNTSRICEPDLIAGIIRDIVGSNEPIANRSSIIKPSDELAHLLINLLNAGQINDVTRRGLEEAIEMCFLHSAAYKSALELFNLEHLGRLIGGFITAHEAIQEIVDRCAGRHQDLSGDLASSAPAVNEAVGPAESSAPRHIQTFDLCEYRQSEFRLFFYLPDSGDAIFELYLEPGHSQEERTDVYFRSFGTPFTVLTFEGYYLPERHRKELEDNSVILSNDGIVIFLGFNGAKLFELRWERKDDGLEAFFDTFNQSTGKFSESLMLWR